MSLSLTFDQLHLRARKNKWLLYFAVFNRIVLALGFIPSGLTKILGERFTSLSDNHPMGNYLEALHHTGFYYTFIGILQVSAAILLLIPRTATLGAVIYFPIILNICILSIAVRFDGSLVSSPLMVLGNLYLLCWDYHKLKFILPFKKSTAPTVLPVKKDMSSRFPFKFFGGVVVTVFLTVILVTQCFGLLPRNTLSDCQTQCEDVTNQAACMNFCDCIHVEGRTLDTCLDAYNRSQH